MRPIAWDCASKCISSRARRPRLGGFGSQYVSPLLSKTMRVHGIRPSMGSISSPWDNAAMESLMGLVSRRACTHGSMPRATRRRWICSSTSRSYTTGPGCIRHWEIWAPQSSKRPIGRTTKAIRRRRRRRQRNRGRFGFMVMVVLELLSSRGFLACPAAGGSGAVAALISCYSSTQCRRPLTPSTPGAFFRACTSRSLSTR